VDGPYPTQGQDGDEIPEWVVLLADDEGDDCGPITRSDSYAAAVECGRELSRQHRLPLEIEATED
jgi:hypothetical protein